MPRPFLPLRVSKRPRVCWVPTPCGPVATHAVSPGMYGMSPAHWGSCQSLGQRLVPPPAKKLHLNTWEEVWEAECAERKKQRLLQEESKSFCVTGSNPNCPISLELRTTLYTSYSRIKLTRRVSTRPPSLASCNTHGVRTGPTLRTALSEDFHYIITLN